MWCSLMMFCGVCGMRWNELFDGLVWLMDGDNACKPWLFAYVA